jgi:Leucine-rich repeat (LRR) protein
MYYPLLDEVACGGVGAVRWGLVGDGGGGSDGSSDGAAGSGCGIGGLVDPAEFDVRPSGARGSCDTVVEYARKIADGGEHNTYFEAECREQTRNYAVKITKALVRIRATFCRVVPHENGGSGGAAAAAAATATLVSGGETRSAGSAGGWGHHVAVLVPGTPVEVAHELWLATLACATAMRTVEGDDVAAAVRTAVGSGYCERGSGSIDDRSGSSCAGDSSGGIATTLRSLPPSPAPAPAAIAVHGQLYFGPVENFAGLERPYVVATGMQHPRYLVHRLKTEPPGSWGKLHLRVDPRMYLAVTRCTYQLSVVEVDVHAYALHFKMSNVLKQRCSGGAGAGGDVGGDGGDGGGSAELWGTNSTTAQTSRAYVEPERSSGSGGGGAGGSGGKSGMRSLRITVDIDLADPPPPHELETATSIQMRALTVDKWCSTTFRWKQCTCGVTELILGNAICDVGGGGGEFGGQVLLFDQMRVHQLLELQVLNLGGNQLTAVPATLENLAQLTHLYLDQNQLTTVPEALGNLAQLTHLYLNQNQLTAVPETLGNLAQLTHLGLHQNYLTAVPAALGNLAQLTQLYLHENQLTAVPAELGNLAQLTHLYLNQNQLTAVPAALGDLAQLTQLYLQQNKLAAVPAALRNLAQLTQLDLQQNQLTAVPAALGNLARLTQLDLHENQLTAVPEALGNLAQLTYLHLHQNQLTLVPEALGNLAQLTRLYLHENQLTAVPAALGNLTGLSEIVVDDHVAASPTCRTTIARLREHGVTVHQHPTGRTPVQVKLLVRRNAKRAAAEAAALPQSNTLTPSPTPPPGQCVCSVCMATKPKAAFAKGQLKKSAAKRKCVACCAPPCMPGTASP